MGAFSNPEGYELWMGRWSARLAPPFLQFAGLRGNERVLDVGSGTGALAEALIATSQDLDIVGIEPAEDYVAYSQARIGDPRATFAHGDALNIPFEDDTFDATLSLLILQELSDVPKAIAEMRRVTKPGGNVAASQWNFKTGMPMLSMFWDAVIEVAGTEVARRTAARTLDVDYPDGEKLSRLWKDSGLIEIEAELQTIEMHFAAFEDYWTPFLSGVTETSSFALTLDKKTRNSVEGCLRERVAERSENGRFTMIAQAWAVKGRAP